MKKPKILLVGPNLPEVGGIATFIDSVANSKLYKKYDFYIFDTGRKLKAFKNASDYTALFRIGLFNTFTSFVKTLIHIFNFPVTILRIKPDIVHINTPSYLPFWENAYYLIISRILSIKAIIHIHGGGFKQFYEKSNPLPRFLIRAIMSISSRIFVLSASWEIFLSRIVYKGKIFKLENFVDVNIFTTQTNGLIDNADGRVNVVFFGGSGAKEKGLYDLIDSISIASATCKNIQLTLVACEGIKGLDKFCAIKKISNRVRIMGYLGQKQKIRVFSESDIFVLPSYAEGLPITLLEAMAMGLPVVVTPVGAIPELIKDGTNGFLVKPKDCISLASKISLLYRDKKLREEMSKINRMFIASFYDKNIVLQKLADQYDVLYNGEAYGDFNKLRSVKK